MATSLFDIGIHLGCISLVCRIQSLIIFPVHPACAIPWSQIASYITTSKLPHLSRNVATAPQTQTPPCQTLPNFAKSSHSTTEPKPQCLKSINKPTQRSFEPTTRTQSTHCNHPTTVSNQSPQSLKPTTVTTLWHTQHTVCKQEDKQGWTMEDKVRQA